MRTIAALFYTTCILFILGTCASALESSALESSALDSAKHPPKAQTLEHYIDLAKKNYPLYAKSELLEQAKAINLQKINMHFIPHFKLQGKASYQSDVTTLPFPDSFINGLGISYTPLTRDQYQIFAELTQPILDINTLSRKPMLKAQFATQKTLNDKDLHALGGNIITLYFSILLLHEQKSQNLLHQKELDKNHQYLQNLRSHGLVSPDSLQKLEIEILKAQKLSATLESQEDSARFMLSQFTQLAPQELKIVLPDFAQQVQALREIGARYSRVLDETRATSAESNQSATSPIEPSPATSNAIKPSTIELFANRPELRYFSAKSHEISLQKQAQNAKYYPYIDAFIQAGYANPGLNFLKGGFQPYYIAGVRFSWDLSHLYTHKQQRELTTNESLIVQKSRDEFVLHSSMALFENLTKARSLLEQTKENAKILALSQKILKAQEARLRNGTLSVNDYITELNNTSLARIQDAYSRIEFIAQVYHIKQMLNEWDLVPSQAHQH